MLTRALGTARFFTPLRALGGRQSSNLQSNALRSISTTPYQLAPSPSRTYATSAHEDAFEEESGSSTPAKPPTSAAPSVNTTFPEPTTVPAVEPLSETSFNDWSKSYHGLSTQPFSSECAEILQAPIDSNDIEMKPGKTCGTIICILYWLTCFETRVCYRWSALPSRD